MFLLYMYVMFYYVGQNFFSLQSPTDMGRVQRRGFCELRFVNKGQELVMF